MTGFDAAEYAAARARAARTLREIEQEATEQGLDLVAGLAGWQAERFEAWTPLASGPALAVRWRGCYRASFGMVHVRPGCRCPK